MITFQKVVGLSAVMLLLGFAANIDAAEHAKKERTGTVSGFASKEALKALVSVCNTQKSYGPYGCQLSSSLIPKEITMNWKKVPEADKNWQVYWMPVAPKKAEAGKDFKVLLEPAEKLATSASAA